MDNKGSIIDTTIHILPSIKLKQYLFTLEHEADIPISILQYINKSKLINNITKNSDETIVNDEKETCDEKDSKLPQEEEIKPKESELLCIDDIKWLSKYLEKARNDGDTIYLHELFEGSDIIMPENETIKRNPVLEARCVKLRRDQMNRDYRSMTKNVDNVRVKHPEETISYQIKNLNKQLVAVGQFIISLGAGFLFGFLGVELMIGHLDFGFRLLLGVMCALVIALAEIYFLAKKLNEDLIINETVQLGGPSVFPSNQKPHSD
ncbi:vacuolar ATPase assembly protein VMA12 [Arctopsyche grandis]|uniref:vacuolar ATPase assembly protein VMA12 n=1 Tax=Arctopsyche grandis TaxID=121162 RepID=UPI00406D7437